MRKEFGRGSRDGRGQSAAEMAILVPVLLLLAIGVVDLGRAFYSYIVITNASREGARHASHLPADVAGTKLAAVNEAASAGLNPPLVVANVTVICANPDRGLPIAVQITYNLPTIIGSIIGMPSLTLRSRTEMVIFGLEPTPTPPH
jgi:hypothetical protein